MGVSIGWRPVNPKQVKWISSTSSFHKALENAFGGFPLTLNMTCIQTLRGIAACGHEGAEELISAILEIDGAIEVEAEW